MRIVGRIGKLCDVKRGRRTERGAGGVRLEDAVNIRLPYVPAQSKKSALESGAGV